MAEEYEVEFERDFVREIEAMGGECLKGDKVKKGFSDQFCFLPGARVYVVEFKRVGHDPKRRGVKMQEHYRKKFRAMGFQCFKVVGREESEKLLRRIRRELGQHT